MISHYEESLQRDRRAIELKVQEMSTLAQRALRDSLRALTERNRVLAYGVILRDQYIDELEKEVDRLCLEFLVRQQPAAGHLRFAYATIKINLELERIGDYAESIARQVLKISGMDFQPSYEKFVAIANLSIPMLQQAVEAFLKQDAQRARSTMVIEEEVDTLRNGINAALLNQRQEGKIPLEALTPLMTIARRFERVSDQAKNICEEVLYMCTGEYIKHSGSEVFRVLFVDEHNSCRSVMAEAIGGALRQPKFVFSSAGLDRQTIDAKTEKFLNDKGLDLTHHTPKLVDQSRHTRGRSQVHRPDARPELHGGVS